MRLLLNIGYQKTGSKSRQKFFDKQLYRLKNTRAVYPLAGRTGILYLDLNLALQQNDRDSYNNIIHHLLEETKDADMAILSHERLYEMTEPKISALKAAFSDITAVLYLRRQDQVIDSMWNQYHKSHRITWKRLKNFENSLQEYNPILNYKDTIRRWQNVLGTSNLVTILYDRQRSPAIDFFRCLGIDVDTTNYTEPKTNLAINRRGLSVLHWIKRLAGEDVNELTGVMKYAHRKLQSQFIPPERAPIVSYRLTYTQRKHIMDHYKSSNEWVKENCFPHLHHLFSPLERDNTYQFDAMAGYIEAVSVLSEYCKSKDAQWPNRTLDIINRHASYLKAKFLLKKYQKKTLNSLQHFRI